MAKTCTKCQRSLDLSGFHNDANRKDGLSPWCKKCAIESARRYYRDGPLDPANRRPGRPKMSPEERANRNRIVTARKMMVDRYGITFEEYVQMYDAQKGCCFICEDHKDRLAIDHCHSTGAIRGLLCRKCNTAIGMLRDDPRLVAKALDYLQRLPVPKTPAAAAVVTWQ